MPSFFVASYRNPIIRSILLLALVAILSVTAMMLVVLIPSDIGRPYESLEATDSHLFDPLELQLGKVTLSYPDGGIMVGAYRRDSLVALVLLAEGTLHYHTEAEELSYPVEQIVLHMHPTAISSIRGQTYIEAQVMPESIVEAQELLALTSSGEPTLEIFGVEKVFMPRPGVLRVEGFGEGHNYRYLHARRTTFTSPFYRDDFIQPEFPMYPPNDQFIWSLAVIFIMVLAVAVALVFLTPDYVRPGLDKLPASSLVWPALILITYLVIETYLLELELSMLVTWGWRVMVVTAILWVGDRHGDSLAFYGLKPKDPLSGIATGLLAGTLLVLAGSIAMPAGLASFELRILSENYFRVLVTTLLFTELLWRGLVQGNLRRYMHPIFSIIITGAFISLAAYTPWIISGGASIDIMLQSLIILPMTAMILGFAYERTGSLYTPLAMASVLYLMPKILIF